MSDFSSFYRACNFLVEADTPPPPPEGAGGPPGMGGPPGGGLPPMGGGPPGMGGDPMGGGEPIPIRTIPAADVWKLLDQFVSGKYDKFFDEINITRKQTTTVHSKKKEEDKSSLMR